MPKPVVAMANTNKHLTPDQKKSREAAEIELQREKVRLGMPFFVKNDKRAVFYWEKSIKLMKGITLHDNLDSDMLAAYCVISSRWERLQELINKQLDEDKFDDRVFARVEAAEKNRLAYAEKLGLTPTSRLRMAKKKAEKKPAGINDDLYGDE